MTTESVTVIITYVAQPNRIEAATTALTELINTVVREERDCLGITMHQDLDDPTRIVLIERWTSRAAYTGPHMNTPHIQQFIAQAGERLAGPPTITFWSAIADARPA